MFHQVEARDLRLFFGLPLPADLCEALAHWQRGHAGVEGWCRPEGLHLTLAFLESRPPEALPGLEGLTGTIASRHRAFILDTAELGSFSRTEATRLLWLGLAPCRALTVLAADLREALLEAGEAIDTKAFHPHVTLARFRQARPLASFSAPPAVRFTADRLVLFESRPKGCYTGLQTWHLRGV